ncbi:hypothetical protein [Mesorhizobium sp. M1322]|uniref:hypothetical protein n=1 Tax=Mesorhizobium sp. M1322 TaxID=2957081 RepID=UPI0033387692
MGFGCWPGIGSDQIAMERSTSQSGALRHQLAARSALSAAVLGIGELLTGKSASAGSVDTTPFGNTQDGKAVDLYTLTNDSRYHRGDNVSDRWGKLDNIVLGFKELADYESINPYSGRCPQRHRTGARGNGRRSAHGSAIQTFLFLISIEAVKSARAMTWLVCVDTSCA